MSAPRNTKQKIRPCPIWGKQADFRQNDAWIRGFVAGRGAGKTRIGALDIILEARRDEPWMGVSPSFPVLVETTLPTFREVAEQLGVFIRQKMTPVPKIHFRTQDGGAASCVFRSGENPDSLRGPSKAGLWLDEASVMHPNVYKYALPVLRHKGRLGRCTMTFTPRGKRHWTFGTFYTRLGDDMQEKLNRYGPNKAERKAGHVKMGAFWYSLNERTALIQARTNENPFLPEGFEELIASQYSKRLQMQELLGLFIDAEGLMFRREDFKPVDVAPRQCLRARYWDRAATDGDGDFTAGVLMAFDQFGKWYIEDIVHGQWSWQQRNEIIMQTAQRDRRLYNNEVNIYVEQEGGSGGKEAAEQMVIMLAGYPVYRDIVSGARHKKKDHERLPGEAKIVRAQPFAAQVEAGNVHYIMGSKWVETMFDELCSFPESSHDDIVDACSGAFNKLATKVAPHLGRQTSVPEITTTHEAVPRKVHGAAVISSANPDAARPKRRRRRREIPPTNGSGHPKNGNGNH